MKPQVLTNTSDSGFTGKMDESGSLLKAEKILSTIEWKLSIKKTNTENQLSKKGDEVASPPVHTHPSRTLQRLLALFLSVAIMR